MADPLDAACPDCLASVGHPCLGTGGEALENPHAYRRRVADLLAVDRGICDVCGQEMVRGSIDGAPVEAWHPDAAAAAACPPLPDPARDWPGWAAAINAGLAPGRPGLQHFRMTRPATPTEGDTAP